MNKKIPIEGIVGLIIVGVLVVVLIFGGQLAKHKPNEINLEMKNQTSSTEYYLGTDRLGRCIFSRIIHGARYSIGSALIALTATFTFSMIYGFVSGYVGGKVDLVLTGVCDLAMAFPPMVIVLSLMGLFSSNVSGLLLAITIASWPWYSKIIRSLVIGEKNKGYVTAARLCGSRDIAILFKHILPNVLNALVVMFFTGISHMILMISGLSYLGIGFGKEIPEWGTMLSNGKTYIFTRPELLVIPGLCIFITSLGLNLIGESLRNGEV